ncbi:hypothetical protein Pelo_18025 [Pelomyxa schiedti]|nr:hypothetical protein Pelo_18025 [Pelomyxa schiedti]
MGIHWLVDFLNWKFTSLWHPGRNVTIDEGIIPFKGLVVDNHNKYVTMVKPGACGNEKAFEVVYTTLGLYSTTASTITMSTGSTNVWPVMPLTTGNTSGQQSVPGRFVVGNTPSPTVVLCNQSLSN